MGLFGRTVIRDEALADLRETEGKFKIAQREMEDIGWRLLSAPYEQQASDLPHLDRNKAIKRGLDYWIRDPLIGQVVDMTADYTIGTGMPVPETEDPKLHAILSRFWSDPDNQLVLTSSDALRTKFIELQLMGNIYLTAFVNSGTGHVKLSDLPPREVTDIITDPDNRKRHLYYKRQTTEYKYDFTSDQYAAGETVTYWYRNWRFDPDQRKDGYRPGKIEEGLVFHWSTNRLSDGKFGNPRVMRIVDWVRAYNEYMRARVSVMRALAKFAWNRKVKGGASDVRKVASAWADGQLAGTQDGTFAPPPQYAATITSNEMSSLEPIKTDTGGSSAQVDGRMIKGQVGVGGGFPLHYLGDIGGANLATATAMELPVLKMIEGFQGYIISRITEIVDFVIAMAIEHGELDALPDTRYAQDRIKDGTFLETHNGSNNDRGKYDYKIKLPSIMKRQVSETVNAANNVLKAIDPYGQNVDASRWALEFALEVMGEPNPKAVVSRVFPAGFEYPTNIEAERGRTDTREGDGKGVVDFKTARKPNSESRLGQKGAKEARQPGEVKTSMQEAEAAVLDLVDVAFDQIDAHATADATE